MMNSYFVPVLEYLQSNPLAFINIISVFLVFTILVKRSSVIYELLKEIAWPWYVALITTILFVYSEAILDLVQNQPPAYFIYIALILTIFFGCLTVYYNANKFMIDGFNSKVDSNQEQSKELTKTTIKLDKQSRELQTKIALARKMSMNTVIEVKTVQDQVKELGSDFKHLESRFDTLEGRFDTLEGRFDSFEVEVRNNFARVDEQFSGVNAQLAIITQLLKDRTN